MHLLKGFVDGFLASDLDSTSKSKHQYDTDDPDYDSESYDRNDSSKYRIHSTDNVHIANSMVHLSELYRSERDNCLNSLIIRYGEGCVQHLSDLLKSNNETILTLSQQLQNNINSLKEVNSKVESAAIEHLQLKNENNKLLQQLQQLSSENIGLKSQLTQADITIKSNDKHIVGLNELLRDNKSTFENMKARCGEFYKLKHEIEELKKKLSFSENHVTMLKKERDEFWSDPKRVLTDEDYKRRIFQALEREDRSISVAKIMASQPPNLESAPKVKVVDSKATEFDDQLVNELRVRVEKLEYENTHLKEINDSLHTMYADLSKSMSEVKSSYLRESIEAFSSYFPPKTKPIQLVFIQPTGVLDLDFNPESLGEYSGKPHGLQSVSETYKKSAPLAKDSSESFTSSHTQASKSSMMGSGGSGSLMSSGSLPKSVGYSGESTTLSKNLKDSPHQSFKSSQEQEPVKKASPKMNFRSRVIKYVTNLDSSPPQSVKNEEPKLLDLDSPQPTRPTEQQSHSLPEPDLGLLPTSPTSPGKKDKPNTWSSDWDFFEDQNEPPIEALKVSQSPVADSKENSAFDLILNEENDLSKGFSTSVPNPFEEFGSSTSFTPTKDSGAVSISKSNYNDSLVDDLFDSIINEHDTDSMKSSAALPHTNEPQGQRKLQQTHMVEHTHFQHPKEPEKPKDSSVKSKKGWDDIDFDDEMFQT